MTLGMRAKLRDGVLTFHGMPVCHSQPVTYFLINDGDLFTMNIDTISYGTGNEHFAS